MVSKGQTFCKAERLCSHKQIDYLFDKGHGYMHFPFSVRWIATDDCDVAPVRVLIVVPKRRLRHAVERNRMKRLTRECYRLRKQRLYEQLSSLSVSPILLSLCYVDNQLRDYHFLERKFDSLLERLTNEIANAKGI